jgi:hypothetical protein
MNKRVRIMLVSALFLAGMAIALRYAVTGPAPEGSPPEKKSDAKFFPSASSPGKPPSSRGFVGGESGRIANPLEDLPDLTWSPRAVEETFAAGDNTTMHRKMLALLIDAPAEHKPGLADHVANLTPDDEYAAIAWLISSRGVEGAAMEALLQDLHHRPADIKLPVMAEILSQEHHPGAREAERALTIYLQVSHGYPSSAWRRAVEAYLATN